MTGAGFTVTVTVNVLPCTAPRCWCYGICGSQGIIGCINKCSADIGALLPGRSSCQPWLKDGSRPAVVGPCRYYITPPFTGVTVNGTPPQVLAVLFAIDGLGLTVTVTVNVFPVQLPKDGVIV